MRELDRDIAAMLDEDLNSLDHNADKKSVTEEVRLAGLSPDLHKSLESARGVMLREMRAVSVDSADITSDPLSSCHRMIQPISSSEINLNSDLDRLSQIGSQAFSSLSAQMHQTQESLPSLKSDGDQESLIPSDLSTEFPSVSGTETSGTAKLISGPSDDERTCRPSSYSRSPIISSEAPPLNLDKMNRDKEVHILKFAALQLSAVKALSVLASSEKFVELLLVPRCSVKDSTADKELLNSIGVHRNENMKASLRQMMRLFVTRSTFPSPFKRAVPLPEMERAFNVLHVSIIQHIAEEKLGVNVLEGRVFMILLICHLLLILHLMLISHLMLVSQLMVISHLMLIFHLMLISHQMVISHLMPPFIAHLPCDAHPLFSACLPANAHLPSNAYLPSDNHPVFIAISHQMLILHLMIISHLTTATYM